MKRTLLAGLLMAAPLLLAAQETEEVSIATDRPSVSTGAGVVPAKSVQLETGIEVSHADGHQMTLPTALVRVGVTKFAEVRLEYDGALAEGSSKWKYHAKPLIFGTKVNIFEGRKWIPQTSLMASFAVPCTKGQSHDMHVAPSVYGLFHNDVCDWLGVDYNVGAEWNGVDGTPTTFVALCLSFSITDNLGAFAESNNYFSRPQRHKHESVNSLNFGLTYLVTKRLQLDMYGGFNCQHPKDGPFVGMGVGWLFK